MCSSSDACAVEIARVPEDQRGVGFDGRVPERGRIGQRSSRGVRRLGEVALPDERLCVHQARRERLRLIGVGVRSLHDPLEDRVPPAPHDLPPRTRLRGGKTSGAGPHPRELLVRRQSRRRCGAFEQRGGFVGIGGRVLQRDAVELGRRPVSAAGREPIGGDGGSRRRAHRFTGRRPVVGEQFDTVGGDVLDGCGDRGVVAPSRRSVEPSGNRIGDERVAQHSTVVGRHSESRVGEHAMRAQPVVVDAVEHRTGQRAGRDCEHLREPDGVVRQ